MKKGMIDERLPLMLIGLLIAIPVMLIFIKIASVQAQKANFLMEFYAADIPLVLEAMQAVPGDTQLYYPLEDGFTLYLGNELDGKGVSLQSVGFVTIANEKTSIRVPFHILPLHSVKDGAATGIIIFTKDQKGISITGREIDNTIAACPPPETLKAPIKVFVTKKTFPDGLLDGGDTESIMFAFDNALSREKVDTGTLKVAVGKDIKIRIDGKEPQGVKNKLIINIPQDQKKDYTHITCEFINALAPTGYIIEKTYENTDDFIFYFVPVDQNELLRLNDDMNHNDDELRHTFADAFAQALKPYGEIES